LSIISSSSSRVIGFPVAAGDPALADDPAGPPPVAALVPGVECLKMADTMLPKMLMVASCSFP
jgi:hypothetical protein